MIYRFIAAGFLGFVLILNSAGASEIEKLSTITVGGRDLSVPAPMGFERCDGISADFDRLIKSALPPSNLPVAYFGEPELVEKMRAGEVPDLTRSFNIQSLIATTDREISSRQFVGIRKELHKELGAMDAGAWNEVFEKASENLNSGDAESVLFDQLGNAKVFVDSNDYFGFSIAVRVNVAGVSKPMISSGVMTIVNGKLLLLYGAEPMESKKSAKMAENAVMQWAESIRSANPVFVPKFGLQNRIILLVCVGIVAVVIVMRARKRRSA